MNYVRRIAFFVLLFLLIKKPFRIITAEEKNIFLDEEKTGSIFDISVNVTLYDGRAPQLEVAWDDNLPNSTSYNIIVNPENLTFCPSLPCSMYGISKLETKPKVLIPEQPMTILDEMECSYMLGCNYTLIVETSNAAVSGSKEISIPNCILNVCSCRYAIALPMIHMNGSMLNNDTIGFEWSIEWNDDKEGMLTTQRLDEKLEAAKTYKIYLKINKQTNPTLSWGGRLIPVAENLYSLENISYTITENALRGEIDVKTSQEIPPNSVLNLIAYIEDGLRCSGPQNLLIIKVPTFDESQMDLITKDIKNQHSLWVIGSVIFVCIGAFAILLYIWQRKTSTRNVVTMKTDENLRLPFSMEIQMEDNVNYVDKYIEEARARGLADAFEVPHYSIQLDAEIGEGAFGRVYRGVVTNLGRMRGLTVVAIKQLKRNPSSDEISEFLSEIQMLKSVGTHQNIVCFLGCCTLRPPYLMIMEYVGRGDLLTYLRTVRQYASRGKESNASYADSRKLNYNQSNPVKYIELKVSSQSVQSTESDMNAERQPKPSFAETTYTVVGDEPEFQYILDNKELHSFALQIANGMRYLEEQEITHRDLAARNVLIDERKTLKISDFGLSRYGIYTNTKTRKLPLRWLSIEAIRDNIYSNKSDVWAYGVVLWEIGTLGASPYPTLSNQELISFLMSGQRLEKPDICTQQVYDIMLQCWNEDPIKRPTFQELFKILSPRPAYVDINSLSEDYVFPPIQKKNETFS